MVGTREVLTFNVPVGCGEAAGAIKAGEGDEGVVLGPFPGWKDGR